MGLKVEMFSRLWGRRSRERLQENLEASILVLDGQGGAGISNSQEARVMDLSEDGCCLALPSLALEGFHLNRCLESPQDFPLELLIRTPDGGTWRLQAQVRWTNRCLEEESFAFRVGAKFCGGQSLPVNWRRLLERAASAAPDQATATGS